MTMLRSIAMALGLTAAALTMASLAPGAALAGPHGPGKPPHHDHKQPGPHGHHHDHVVFTHEVRVVIENYYREGRHCPPGLAKKKNGCLPPGHAKKHYHLGKPLPHYVKVERLPRYLRHRLPPPPQGYVYGYVDNDVLLIAEATRQVMDAVVAVNAAMNALR